MVNVAPNAWCSGYSALRFIALPFPSLSTVVNSLCVGSGVDENTRVLDTLHSLAGSTYEDVEHHEFMALFLKFLHRYAADFQSLTDLTGTIGHNVTGDMDPGPQNKMLGENPIALPQQDARMHKSPGAAIQRQVISMRDGNTPRCPAE